MLTPVQAHTPYAKPGTSRSQCFGLPDESIAAEPDY